MHKEIKSFNKTHRV